MSGWFEETQDTGRLLAQEDLVLEVTERLVQALERRGVSRTAFADALGVEKSEVSQRLNGRRNLTLRSLSDMAHALECSVEFRLRDLKERVAIISEARPIHYGVTGTGTSLNLLQGGGDKSGSAGFYSSRPADLPVRAAQ